MPEAAARPAPPLLDVRDLAKSFAVRGGLFERKKHLFAVDGVSFSIRPGETLGLVGESGCGKTTTARLILGFEQPSAGEIHFQGRRIDNIPSANWRAVRRDLQFVFQDPYSSLSPRMRAADIVGEPLKNFGVARKERDEEVADLFRLVGLPRAAMSRFPHEFSGGQRQRIGIARALALRPKLIVCDEPVSALDVSIQAQVINLLDRLRAEFSISYLFVAHDLAIVEHISDRVAVMYLGKIVEIADRASLFSRPRHPYTEALLSAAPRADPKAPPRRILLKGDPPSPLDPPSGCRFRTRCGYADARCESEEPPLIEASAGHFAACHLRDAAALQGVPPRAPL